MATTVAELLVGLGVSVEGAKEAEKSLDDVDKSAEALEKKGGSSLKEFAKTAATGFAAVATAAVATGAAIFKLASDAAASGAAIDDAAKRAGVGAREYQRLAFAAEQAGAGPEVLAEAFKSLNLQLTNSAKTGTGPAADALKKLGLSAHDLVEMVPEDRIAAIADAFTKLEGDVAQGAAAAALFGGAGSKLLPLLNEGGAAIRAYGDDAERLGLVLDDLAIEKAAELDDQLGVLHKQLDMVATDVGVALIPVVSEIVEDISNWVAENKDLIETEVSAFLEEMLPLVKEGAELVFELVGAMGEFVDGAGGAENALMLVAGGFTAIKLAALGIPGAAAAAGLAIGAFAGTAISELSGVNAELRRTEALLNSLREFKPVAERGQEAFDKLDGMSADELAKLSDREFQRQLDLAEKGINARASLAGGQANLEEGTAAVLKLRENLNERRGRGLRVKAITDSYDKLEEADKFVQQGVKLAEKAAPKKKGGGKAKEKKEEEQEFHLTSLEQAIRSTTPGIDIKKLGLSIAKIKPSEVKPQSVINVTNNTFHIKQDIRGEADPVAIGNAAIAAAKKEINITLSRAAQASQTNVVR